MPRRVKDIDVYARFARLPSTEPVRGDWVVYVLRCRDRSLYVGVTNDLERRLKRHGAGTGAKYTRSRGPLTLQVCRVAGSRSEALKYEYALKQLTKAQKEGLLSALMN